MGVGDIPLPSCSLLYLAPLIALPALYLLRKWFDGGRCTSKVRLDGKTVVVTGANTGIGKETAIDMAQRGARVVMACRSAARGSAALSEVKEKSGSGNVFLELLDLASLKSVREFVEKFSNEYKELDILINNAGVMMCPSWKTEDGFEMQFGVNHLGHFALTNLLLPNLKENARIVNVSSNAHYSGVINFDDINSEKKYSSLGAYCQSKLANVIFTRELSKMLIGTDITTYSLHPGVIKTELGRHLGLLATILTMAGPLVLKSPLQGAQTSIYCAVEEGIEKYSGAYYADCALKVPHKLSCDEGLAKKLWEKSELMTGITFPRGFILTRRMNVS